MIQCRMCEKEIPQRVSDKNHGLCQKCFKLDQKIAKEMIKHHQQKYGI
ncbi:hypothetical protein [Ammoniphilus sp. 3BR4]